MDINTINDTAFRSQLLFYLNRQKMQTIIMGCLSALLFLFVPISPATPILFLLLLSSIYFYVNQDKDVGKINSKVRDVM